MRISTEQQAELVGKSRSVTVRKVDQSSYTFGGVIYGIDDCGGGVCWIKMKEDDGNKIKIASSRVVEITKTRRGNR
jgi:hypothetical protein